MVYCYLYLNINITNRYHNMNNQEVLIKYNIDEIFSCMDDNILLPPELEELEIKFA